VTLTSEDAAFVDDVARRPPLVDLERLVVTFAGPSAVVLRAA
jgi:hypothetical protein